MPGDVFAGLHDLGKLSSFQEREAHPWARVSEVLRADTRSWGSMPHERASMHSVLQLLAEAGYEVDTSDSAGVLVAQMLGGHHGRFLQLDIDGAARASRVNLVLGGPAWQDLRRRYFALVRHLTGVTMVPSRVPVPAAVLITGVGVIADRLASQRHYWLPKAQAPAFGAGEHYAQAVKDAPVLLDGSGLPRVALPPASFAQAHRGLTAPNDLQASLIRQLTKVVEEKGPGIVVVTDATGGGKTVTGLEAARIFNADGATAGIVWLLPTTATADASYEILERYVAAHRPERAPVSLVYSHSWNNSAYTECQVAADGASTTDEFWPEGPDDREDPDGAQRPEERVTVPDGWLRGWDRALLAQFTVATHDQALMAALPVRFSALRMLALSGRTVIVDEAHALTPFMQQLLGRLLHWLGALGCPVVLLSATMPARVSTELVRSYLAGAGNRPSSTSGLDCAPAYPGWLFAAAADASLTRMDSRAGEAHAQRHRRTASLRLYPVRHSSHTDPDDAPARESRLERISAEIAPVVQGGGCAAVACATMADAQAAYQHLHDTLPWPGGPAAAVARPPARPSARGPHPPDPRTARLRRRAPRTPGHRHHQPPRHEPRHRRRRHGQRPRLPREAPATPGPAVAVREPVGNGRRPQARLAAPPRGAPPQHPAAHRPPGPHPDPGRLAHPGTRPLHTRRCRPPRRPASAHPHSHAARRRPAPGRNRSRRRRRTRPHQPRPHPASHRLPEQTPQRGTPQRPPPHPHLAGHTQISPTSSPCTSGIMTGRGTAPSPSPAVYASFITPTSASHIRASTDAPSVCRFRSPHPGVKDEAASAG